MKKVFALSISLLLLVSFAVMMSVTGAAAETTPATSLKIGGTILDASNATMTAGSGTAKFDATTGTLTLNNASIGKISEVNGDLIILANGTNTLTAESSGFAVHVPNGGLTIGGTGSLEVTAPSFGFYIFKGNLTVTDSVTFKLNAAQTYAFGATNDNSIIFEEDCKVTISGVQNLVFSKTMEQTPGAGTHSMIVKDNADVTLKSLNLSSGHAVLVREINVSGGKLTVDAKDNAVGAYAVKCDVFKQSGGKVSITSTVTTEEALNCNTFEQTGGKLFVTGREIENPETGDVATLCLIACALASVVAIAAIASTRVFSLRRKSN